MKARSSFGNRVMALVLSVIMLLSMVPTGVIAVDDSIYGTVEKVTDGVTFEGEQNGQTVTANFAGTLTWVGQDDNSDRDQDGWWVGIKVTAPEGMTQMQLQNAKYQINGEKKYFWEKMDSKNQIVMEEENIDGDAVVAHYIELWGLVKPEYLINENLNGDGVSVYTWTFDWLGDGSKMQTVMLQISSENTTLIKDDEIVYAYEYASVERITQGVTFAGDVCEGSVVSATYQGTLQWAQMDKSVGRNQDGWWVGIKVNAPDGLTQGQLKKAKYKVNGGNEKVFWELKDSKPVKKDNTEEDDDNAVVSHYIELWGLVTPEYLLESRSTFTWTFDWTGNGTFEQTITLKIDPNHTELEKENKKMYPLGTIKAYTGSEVSYVGSGTSSTSVTITDATLEWSPEDKMLDRAAGWWAGIQVTAPANMTLADLKDAKYQVKNSEKVEWSEVTTAKSFLANKDSGDAEPSYIQLWLLITPQSLAKFRSEGRYMAMYYHFDWDGNGTYDQEITFRVDPKGEIELLKAPAITDAQAYVDSDNSTQVSFEYTAELGLDSITVDNVLQTATENGIVKVKLPDTREKVTIQVKDVHGNIQSVEIAVQQKLGVELQISEGTGGDSVAYYNKDNKPTFTVKVSNADDDQYKVETAVLRINGINEEITLNNGEGSFTYEGEDATLSDLKVTVKDAKNREASSELDGEYVYDTKGPSIEITPNKEAKNQYGEKDYYDSLIFTVKVSDENLTTTNGLEICAPKNVAISDWSEKNGVYEATVTVADGVTLSQLSVNAVDNAQNASQSAYAGNPAVVDSTSPEVNIKVEGAENATVAGFYTKDDKVYIKLDTPVKGNSGEAVEAKEEKVILTVTATDANMALDDDEGFSLVNNLKEDSITWVEENGSYTYTVELTAGPDGVVSKDIDLQVFDLAGNPGVFKVESLGEGKSTFDPDTENDDDQKFAATIVLDRRRPSSGEETEIPVLTVTADKDSKVNGRELYDGEFNFLFSLTGEEEEMEVEAGVTDGNEFVTGGDCTYKEGTYTLPVTLTKEPGECNNAKLSIKVTDPVGNEIYYTKEFAVDTQAPVVTVTKFSNDEIENEEIVVEDVALRKVETDITVTVEDINLESFQMVYCLNGQKKEVVMDSLVDGKYTISLKNGDVLSAISIKATDLAGNVTQSIDAGETGLTFKWENEANIYEGNKIAVDTEAPDVSVIGPNNPIKTVTINGTNVDFYADKLTYTVVVKDELPLNGGAEAKISYTLDGQQEPVELDLLTTTEDGQYSYQGTFDVTNDEVLTDIEISVKDAAGRAPEGVTTMLDPESGDSTVSDIDFDCKDGVLKYKGHWVAVDMTAPEVTVNKVPVHEDEESYVQSIQIDGQKIDFYNNEITYNVTVKDRFLDNDIVVVNAVFEDSEQMIKLTLNKSTETAQIADMDIWTGSFNVTEGKVLKKICLVVLDNANHEAEKVDVTETNGNTSFENSEALDGKWTYNGNWVAVDMTAPEVIVETSTKDYVQTYEGVDYYDNQVEYKVTVRDRFLEDAKNKQLIVKAYFEGEENPVEITEWTHSVDSEGELKLNDMDVWTSSFTVKNGEVLTDIEILVKDAAGRAPEDVTTTLDPESGDSTVSVIDFVCKDGIWKYEGNWVAVDTEAPEVEVSFSDNVTGYYYRTEEGENYYYVIVNPAVNNNSGVVSSKDQTVDMYVTVLDKNITLNQIDSLHYVKNLLDDDSWTVTEDNGKIVFHKSITVQDDNTASISFKIQAYDLAGNSAENVTLKDRKEENGNPVWPGFATATTQEDGVIAFGDTVIIDRRRATSVEQEIPEIKLTIPKPYVNVDKLNLYNSDVTFIMDVWDMDQPTQDGSDKSHHNSSGLASIEYKLEGAEFASLSESNVITYGDGVFSDQRKIIVKLNNVGESNDVELLITVTDKVGNKISYAYSFALDNQAPRVDIAYNNNSARNEKYFKADRTATITVEDINFNPAETTVYVKENEVRRVGTWRYENGKHIGVVEYAEDGDYQFSMYTTDIAGHTTKVEQSGNSTQLGSKVTFAPETVAPYVFTVDKTAPVISVEYAPLRENGVDPSTGVLHFNADRKITATITEVNFNAGEVDADLGNKNSLSNWRSNGSVHTASDIFKDGNEYKVTINYIDLAGNEAKTYVSPVFTVDTEAPTISITSGPLKQDALNVVPDKLDLGFTINDAQSNLMDYDVKIFFMDSAMKSTILSDVSTYYTSSATGDGTNVYVNFNDLPNEKGYDGIYTVQMTARDFAGNTISLSPDLVYSVNRFGSTFLIEDADTSEFLTADENGGIYHDKVEHSLIIKEINPNQVWPNAEHSYEGAAITMSVNGTSRVLTAGKDYIVTVSNQKNANSDWYVYTYEILSDNFYQDGQPIDGNYDILFYSEDAANNKNTNEANEGSAGKLSFTMDSQKPVVTIIGLEKTSINATNKLVTISVTDSTYVSIQVFVDDKLVELQDASATRDNTKNWLIKNEDGTYTLNLTSSDHREDIRVVIEDAAGNVLERTVKNVIINDNALILFVANTPLLLGTIFGLIALIIIVILLIVRKKNKKEAK